MFLRCMKRPVSNMIFLSGISYASLVCLKSLVGLRPVDVSSPTSFSNAAITGNRVVRLLPVL